MNSLLIGSLADVEPALGRLCLSLLPSGAPLELTLSKPTRPLERVEIADKLGVLTQS